MPANDNKTDISMFNARLPTDLHIEIKMTAIQLRMTLSEYLTFLHNRYARETRSKRHE